MAYKIILSMCFFPAVLLGADAAAEVKARQEYIAKKKAVFEKVVRPALNFSNKEHPTAQDVEKMENGLKWAKAYTQQIRNEFPGLAAPNNPVDIDAQHAHQVMDQHIRLLEGEIEAVRAKCKKSIEAQMENDARMAEQEQAKENARAADAEQRRKQREKLKQKQKDDTEQVIGEHKEVYKNNIKLFYDKNKTAIWIGSGLFVVGLMYFVAQKLDWIGKEKQPEKETAKA